MTDKKKPTVQPLPPKKMSDAEAAKVKGGMAPTRAGVGGVGGIVMQSDQCKETTDTGITGCPG